MPQQVHDEDSPYLKSGLISDSCEQRDCIQVSGGLGFRNVYVYKCSTLPERAV